MFKPHLSLPKKFLFLALCLFCCASHAAKRVALVIGNAQYQSEKALRNTLNDADLIANVLRQDLEFDDVMLRKNLTRRDLNRAIGELTEKAKGADAVVVYYSGHGMQKGGQNYLLPIDAAIQQENDIDSEGVASAKLLAELEAAGAKVTVVILDACRDNPYSTRTKGTAKGLARMNDVSEGMLVAYATRDGSTADDGEGKNSPYAIALARQLKRTDQPVRLAFEQVADDVKASTANKQKPITYGDLKSSVFLSPFGKVKPISGNAQQAAKPDVEKELWDLCKSAQTVGACEDYLSDYPGGTYTKLAKRRVVDLTAKPVSGSNPNNTSNVSNVSTTTSTGSSVKDCPDCPELVVLPGGSFSMGSSASEQAQANAAGLAKRLTDREGPQHIVNIKAFALGKAEVTRGQFAAFVADTGHNAGESCWVFANGKWADTVGRNWRNPGYSQTENDPVACLNWDDAQAYVRWLAQKSGKRYRLPSEAEWEYACRAGSNQTYCGSDNVDSVAVYGRKSGDKTQPVASKQANAWGLFDMSGNVWEWTQDCLNETYNGAPSNGDAWQSGNCGQRVLRGGSWSNDPSYARAAIRNRGDTSDRLISLGFRVARMLP